MSAFASGQEVQDRQPTLASVAYMASLGAFAQPEQCNGKVSCSDCGDRPAHHLTGDSDAIANLVSQDLGLETDDEREARSLIKSVYSRQRSSYVHDAILRHNELGTLPSFLARPAGFSTVSEELMFYEELNSIGRLARRQILSRLANQHEEIRDSFRETFESKIRYQLGHSGSITVAKAGRPVGVRMQPPVE